MAAEAQESRPFEVHHLAVFSGSICSLDYVLGQDLAGWMGVRGVIGASRRRGDKAAQGSPVYIVLLVTHSDR